MEEEIKKENTESKTEIKKKPNGCLIVSIVLLSILVMLGASIYFIYQKITTMSEQVDLGVTYTQQDFEDAMNNAGFEIDDPDRLALDKTYPIFTDPKQIEVNITGAQASAWLETVNKTLEIAKIENTQIRFSKDKAELSTMFTYQGKTYPVYVSGNITKESSKTVNGTIFEVKAGSVKLPSNINSIVETTLENIANDKLASLGDTLNINELSVTENGLHFDGMFPTKIKE